MMPKRLSVLLWVLLAAAGCGRAPAGPVMTMNEIAERYVKLVLAVGQHDELFVDAYYGDPAWKPAGTPPSLPALAAQAEKLRADLRSIDA